MTYRRRHGHYPQVCADQSYRTRAKPAFCQRHGIRLSGPHMGRPKNDPELVAAEMQKFIDDQRKMYAVEGKFGLGNRCFGLGMLSCKLSVTKCSMIALNVLEMSLKSSWTFLFVLFTALLRLVLVNEGGRSISTVSLKNQMATA